MKKIINYLLLIIFVSTFIDIKSVLFDCIQHCDRLKEDCAYKCLQQFPCTANCEPHYVLTDCVQICDECAQGIKIALEECDQMRSNCVNSCIQDFCLDPWVCCPSCGMGF